MCHSHTYHVEAVILEPVCVCVRVLLFVSVCLRVYVCVHECFLLTENKARVCVCMLC